MKKIIKAINEGLHSNRTLILFEDDETFKKSSNVNNAVERRLWIENNTVDLGLPSGTRWAKCNAGAETPTDYGLYFQCGDPVGHFDASNKNFSKFDYKWYDLSKEYCTKYNDIDKKTELDLEDDPAYMYSDGMLVSPTKLQYKELIDYCTWTWTEIDFVRGYKIQSKVNDEYIFLPACGYGSANSVSYGRTLAKYLSRNVICYYGGGIYFNNTTIIYTETIDRSYGISVRGVLL